MINVVEINADGPAIEDERVPALNIVKNGEKQTYTIPREISGATALRALEVFVRAGESATTLWLAEHALGEEAMELLMNTQQLKIEQVQELLRNIGEQYIGQVRELGKP